MILFQIIIIWKREFWEIFFQSTCGFLFQQVTTNLEVNHLIANVDKSLILKINMKYIFKLAKAQTWVTNLKNKCQLSIQISSETQKIPQVF